MTRADASEEVRGAPAPVLLFDVMDTLVREPYWRTAPEFFGLSLEELQAVQDPRAWIEFELGRIDEAAMCERFFADRRSFDRAAFVEAMTGRYRWVEGMEDLLGRLAATGHEIHALSNYSVWYRRIDEQLGLFRSLAWSFVSCDTGVRKPHPDAFLGPPRTLGVRPERCLLVDDRESNCAAARKLGLAAERFRGADELRRAFVARGLLAA